MPATTLVDRALVRLSGEDVYGFLQGLVTVDTANVTAVAPKWAGLLNPQGKCLFDFILWGDGLSTDGEIWVDCEQAAAPDLISRLSTYRLRRPIKIQLLDDLAVHWSAERPTSFGQGNTFGAAQDPRVPELGYRWIDEPNESASGWLEHRLRLGVTEGRAELGDLLWLECNAAELNGVSFTKGCFVGQENTARMNWRQKVNRRLVVVEGDGGDRARIAYPELGLSVVHARTDALPPSAIVPAWLEPALAL